MPLQWKVRFIPLGLCAALALGILTGCSSVSRERRKPSVAIAISVGNGERPSPSALAEMHALLQPEIEKRGYVIAKSSRSADYFVHVRYPVDPLSISGLQFVRAEPTVPFLKDYEEWQRDQRNRTYKRAIAEMVRDPK